MANRYSTYSNGSSQPAAVRSAAQQSTQVSTTTLLNALHTVYASGQTYQLDSSTSIAANTWLTAINPDAHGRVGGTVDADIASRAWEHARRRAEDACVILASLHPSTPSVFQTFLQVVPLPTPSIVNTALSALRPFLCCATPINPTTHRLSSFSARYTVTLSGTVTGFNLALSGSGIDVEKGLLRIPSQPGNRAFDVFYYLLTSASTPAEREFLSLQHPSKYALLNRSGTYEPPTYLPAADDTAAAEDFRVALKAIGIKGASFRGLLSCLAGLLKLGETVGFLVDSDILEDVCEDVGALVGLEPEVLLKKCTTDDREVLIAGMYEALVDWVISKANDAIAAELRAGALTPDSSTQDGDEVSFTVVEIYDETLGKAVTMRNVFDDTFGINAEMKDDGIEVVPAGHSVLKEMQAAVAQAEADLGIKGTPLSREREHDRDRREAILERIGAEAEDGGFLHTLLYPVDGEGLNFGRRGRFDLGATVASSRAWYQLSIHPTDESPSALAALPSPTSAWSAGAVSRQLRAWRLPEWANHRNRHLDFTADFDFEEFVTRYSRLGCKDGKDGIETFLLERGWTNGEVVIGRERVWMRESAWWEAESMLDMKPVAGGYQDDPAFGQPLNPFASGYSANMPHNGSGFFPPVGDNMSLQDSRENLLAQATTERAKSLAPTMAKTVQSIGGDYGLGPKGDSHKDHVYYDADLGVYTGELDPEFGDPRNVESKPTSAGRQAWVSVVWALTWWIPSIMLRYIGGMKRPDVRMAWREKVVLVFIIFLINGIIVFYFVEFGRLLCPNFDKAWNAKEVGYHTGTNDVYVSIHGKVYDITKFYRLQHSDTSIETNAENMLPLAGQNLDAYFPPPLSRACPGLDIDESVTLQHNNTDAVQYPNAVHTSGERLQTNTKSALHSWNWYSDRFLPKIKEYYKGDLVVSKHSLKQQAENSQRMWVVIHKKIYDFTDYFYTLDQMNNYATYKFFPDEVTDLVSSNPGLDITDKWGTSASFQTSLNCMDNAFYVGKVDFRDEPKCQVNNYMMLAFSIVLCSVILVKFLAALQLGSKRRPAPQDKFVICQVPAYTEGEDHLRKSLDSLTALQYDNKRKLICVICDGMIVGGGNDRPTPKIVLDILGVDPKIDPPALPFRSVGNGNEQLNYGKVYSGLYEYEGNVVPYIVIVKVGKESEQSKSKPGNRGKRDSQVLLMQFLNRVHHRSPMSPLELEMFHQINNIIGVDPELYEYLLMVDADTMVKEDSLNRLVAACANDAKIAGICGETSLENEERSWWTMIQVYEYYISHHLSKAFESLFGSVTCLPGCFCMYRLRTADKGRPLIISDKVIQEYSDCDVDTLHKKNLLSLGEDRYLTTLMTKHFPAMSYKFIPDAYALTAAPETWSVLLSQRRRWINSTIHNLAELVWLKDLCGFCCFSMRFVVFVDLFGTIVLPATCIYMVYLIYRLASNTGQFPLISIVMIAAVYGLQAIIFIIKRQWQHVGWMIIYILAYPIYSFVLPIYSFWNQDNFSWGNTRIVIGEKGDKKVVAIQDEGFDPRSIPLQRWDDYAAVNNLPGRRGNPGAYPEKGGFDVNYTDDPAGMGGMMEMDDMHSTYSSVKPSSTILTGFGKQQHPYMAPPRSPAPFGNMNNRASTMTGLTQFRDQPVSLHGRNMSMMSLGSQARLASPSPGPYQDQPRSPYQSGFNGMQHSVSRPSLLGMGTSRPASTIMDFRTVPSAGPSDHDIIEAIRTVLSEVDLDTVTKKQVRALVEQRLQCEIPAGERRQFLDKAIDGELANM
ncbi:Chitin synthase 6 [Exophiala dermatitidis]|uniref:Chitin synthase A n=1 Tax=Exophiala dermatitidis (strain ATCC 34100 / CBS 525.76 / NIH/UT8656) TaxID=858893 RepID=H6CAN6_EXODN|nr:chitin synthase [Exophiala dermatitidis NIH/UT8656]EHY60833.1 chitin synthase [Exophiala dermatitidis NIH/UT8656]